MRQRLAAGVFGLGLLVVSDARGIDLSTATPAQRCAAEKSLVLAASAGAQIDCYKNAFKNPGGVVDPACVEKARQKLRDGFAAAEAKGGCVTVGDADAVNTRVADALGLAVAPLLPPTGTPTCDCGSPAPEYLQVRYESASGTCGTSSGGGGPTLGLDCGLTYIGGGTVWGVLPQLPATSPYLTRVYKVTSCAGSRLQLAEATAAEVGDRFCTEPGCRLNPPTNGSVPGTCFQTLYRFPPSGTADCKTGELNLATPLDIPIYGAACPVCTDGFCASGENAGGHCTGDLGNGTASVDCAPSLASQVATGFTFDLVLTTGEQSKTAVSTGSQSPVFCGFCADGGGVFENPARRCVLSTDCSASPYTSCRQYGAGAFGSTVADLIAMAGTLPGDLSDGGEHSGTMVSVFCLGPTFNAGVDASGGLPAPVAFSRRQSFQLVVTPSLPTTSTVTSTTTTTSSTTSTT